MHGKRHFLYLYKGQWSRGKKRNLTGKKKVKHVKSNTNQTSENVLGEA